MEGALSVVQIQELEECARVIYGRQKTANAAPLSRSQAERRAAEIISGGQYIDHVHGSGEHGSPLTDALSAHWKAALPLLWGTLLSTSDASAQSFLLSGCQFICDNHWLGMEAEMKAHLFDSALALVLSLPQDADPHWDPPFALQLESLLCRITKLGWREDQRYSGIGTHILSLLNIENVSSVDTMDATTFRCWMRGLSLFDQLLADIQRPHALASQERMVVRLLLFRDSCLRNVYMRLLELQQLVMNCLATICQFTPDAAPPTAQQIACIPSLIRVGARTLEVSSHILAFDFSGIKHSDPSATDGDSSLLILPSSWPVFGEADHRSLAAPLLWARTMLLFRRRFWGQSRYTIDYMCKELAAGLAVGAGEGDALTENDILQTATLALESVAILAGSRWSLWSGAYERSRAQFLLIEYCTLLLLVFAPSPSSSTGPFSPNNPASNVISATLINLSSGGVADSSLLHVFLRLAFRMKVGSPIEVLVHCPDFFPWLVCISWLTHSLLIDASYGEEAYNPLPYVLRIWGSLVSPVVTIPPSHPARQLIQGCAPAVAQAVIDYCAPSMHEDVDVEWKRARARSSVESSLDEIGALDEELALFCSIARIQLPSVAQYLVERLSHTVGVLRRGTSDASSFGSIDGFTTWLASAQLQLAWLLRCTVHLCDEAFIHPPELFGVIRPAKAYDWQKVASSFSSFLSSCDSVSFALHADNASSVRIDGEEMTINPLLRVRAFHQTSALPLLDTPRIPSKDAGTNTIRHDDALDASTMTTTRFITETRRRKIVGALLRAIDEEDENNDASSASEAESEHAMPLPPAPKHELECSAIGQSIRGTVAIHAGTPPAAFPSAFETSINTVYLATRQIFTLLLLLRNLLAVTSSEPRAMSSSSEPVAEAEEDDEFNKELDAIGRQLLDNAVIEEQGGAGSLSLSNSSHGFSSMPSAKQRRAPTMLTIPMISPPSMTFSSSKFSFPATRSDLQRECSAAVHGWTEERAALETALLEFAMRWAFWYKEEAKNLRVETHRMIQQHEPRFQVDSIVANRFAVINGKIVPIESGGDEHQISHTVITMPPPDGDTNTLNLFPDAAPRAPSLSIKVPAGKPVQLHVDMERGEEEDADAEKAIPLEALAPGSWLAQLMLAFGATKPVELLDVVVAKAVDNLRTSRQQQIVPPRIVQHTIHCLQSMTAGVASMVAAAKYSMVTNIKQSVTERLSALSGDIQDSINSMIGSPTPYSNAHAGMGSPNTTSYTAQFTNAASSITIGDDLLQTVCIQTLLKGANSMFVALLNHVSHLKFRAQWFNFTVRLLFLHSNVVAAPRALFDKNSMAMYGRMVEAAKDGEKAAAAALKPFKESVVATAKGKNDHIFDTLEDGQASWFADFMQPIEAPIGDLQASLGMSVSWNAPYVAHVADGQSLSHRKLSPMELAPLVEPTARLLWDLRGVYAAAASSTEYKTVHEWGVQRCLFTTLNHIAMQFRKQDVVTVALLKLLLECTSNREHRIVFPPSHVGAYVLHRECCRIIATISADVVMSTALTACAPKLSQLLLSVSAQLLGALNVNRGVMTSFGDSLHADLWHTTLQLILSISMDDIRTLPKLCAACQIAASAIAKHRLPPICHVRSPTTERESCWEGTGMRASSLAGPISASTIYCGPTPVLWKNGEMLELHMLRIEDLGLATCSTDDAPPAIALASLVRLHPAMMYSFVRVLMHGLQEADWCGMAAEALASILTLEYECSSLNHIIQLAATSGTDGPEQSIVLAKIHRLPSGIKLSKAELRDLCTAFQSHNYFTGSVEKSPIASERTFHSFDPELDCTFGTDFIALVLMCGCKLLSHRECTPKTLSFATIVLMSELVRPRAFEAACAGLVSMCAVDVQEHVAFRLAELRTKAQALFAPSTAHAKTSFEVEFRDALMSLKGRLA